MSILPCQEMPSKDENRKHQSNDPRNIRRYSRNWGTRIWCLTNFTENGRRERPFRTSTCARYRWGGYALRQLGARARINEYHITHYTDSKSSNPSCFVRYVQNIHARSRTHLKYLCKIIIESKLKKVNEPNDMNIDELTQLHSQLKPHAEVCRHPYWQHLLEILRPYAG